MKIFIKEYYLDVLILGGILLKITNHFFKLTEYKITEYVYSPLEFEDDPFAEVTSISVHYDFVGYIAVVSTSIGLYVLIRRFINKKFS